MRTHAILHYLEKTKPKRLPARFARATAAVLIGVAPMAAWGSAWAIADTTPPVLDSVVRTGPSTLDISTEFPSSGSQFPLMYDIGWHDDLSGYSSQSYAVLSSPSGQQYMTAPVNPPFSEDGDISHVEFDVQVHAEAGAWTMTVVLVDATGNTVTFSNAELLGRSYDIGVSFYGTDDTQKPVLNSATLTSPTTVDTTVTNGNTDINTIFTATDNNPGWDSSKSSLTFTSPSGNLSFSNQLAPNGPDTAVTVSLPQYAEGGTWTPSISLADAVGNTQVYSNNDLLNMGIDLRFTVVGTADTAGPVVHTLNIGLAQPVIEDVPLAGGQITFLGEFTDDLSGLGSNTRINYASVSGTQHATAYFYVGQPTIGMSQGTVDLPPYGESGVWQPTLITSDNIGNERTYTATDLTNLGIKVSFDVTKRVVAHLMPGQTLSSDEENDGTTATDGVEATVTSPVEGDASISVISSDGITDVTNNYTLFNRQISIHAPQASAASPLTLTFQIDSSLIPNGENQNTLQISRNGVVLPACADQTTANPDACIFNRQLLSGGDVKLSIHSSHASIWGAGFTKKTYDFKGFQNPIKAAPLLNKADAGDTVKIKFDLGGNQGLNVFATEPVVRKISCTTKTVDPNSASVSAKTGEKGLRYKQNGIYEYSWDTKEAWEGTCRQLSFKFSNGEVQTLFFKFKD